MTNDFNPRSPHGERLCCYVDGRPEYEFQSTLSSRRATVLGDFYTFLNTDFNPRSPHGERLAGLPVGLVPGEFQSTLSSRRATRTYQDLLAVGEFQSTLSSRRATAQADSRIRSSAFQSTLSSRRATRSPSFLSRRRQNFNPRSPHGERRAMAIPKALLSTVFQSTLSSRRATAVNLRFTGMEQISIHALLTESDLFGCNLGLRPS